jgi:integrase
MQRIKVPRFQGLYYRKSGKRNHLGKPDKCFDITFKAANGRLTWEKVGWASEGYTAQMAAQVRGERIRTLRHGKELPPKKGDRTLQSVWDKDYKAEKSVKKSYADDYWRYDKHIKPVFGSKRLSEIEPAGINELKNDLARNVARSNGVLDGNNPVSWAEYPSTKNSNRLPHLKPDEAEKLLDKLKATSRSSYLSLYAAMRADEIFKLRWQGIDLNNDIIHILETKNTEARTACITGGIWRIFENKEAAPANQYVFPQEFQRGKKKRNPR